MSSPLDEFLKAHEKEQDALQKVLQELRDEDRKRLEDVLEIHASETLRILTLLTEEREKQKNALGVKYLQKKPQSGVIVKKVCPGCGAEKPCTEFHKDYSRNDGLTVRCKECVKSTNKRWRDANPDKRLTSSRQSYTKRRRAILKQKADYRLKNQGKIREQGKDYTGRKRAQKHGVESEVVLLSSVIERDGTACYLCGKDPAENPTPDHIIPFNKGGAHIAENIALACLSCNHRKGSKLLEELDWVWWKVKQ